jgi:predicted N-acetyltransferase YhbS
MSLPDGIAVRALAPGDLDAVASIDAAIEGRSRRAYLQRRLAAALREPAAHVQRAAVGPGGDLAGYILARRFEGEFGRSRPGLRLEIVGVRPQVRRLGIGALLMSSLAGYARRHGIGELRTLVVWHQHEMLVWLEAMGFALAPDHVVDCAVPDGWRAERDDALGPRSDEAAGRELNYGTPEANDFERVQRVQCDVQAMRPQDLPQIVRIDRGITGRDRGAYMAAKLGEAMEDAGIRLSFTARVEGAIVGYLMARADLGDFGRTAPVAVLDTLGVDPAHGHVGVGHALVSQLFTDLGALQVDRVETVVACADLALLGFLYGVGFRPSQRLSFLRTL